MENLCFGNYSLITEKQNEIHVHIICPSQVDHKIFDFVLDKSEIDKSQSFVFSKDRLLYSSAHIFLRTVLSQYEPISPEDWQFTCNDYGKPDIANPGNNNLKFNLSHTQSLIVCATGYQHNLGVDIERHKDIKNFTGMCQTVLTEQEREHLFSLKPKQQKQLFFRYWTLKEACVKAIGKGLTIPLQAIEYKNTNNQAWQCNIEKGIKYNGTLYSFYHTFPPGDYSLALTVQLDTTDILPKIRFFDWRTAAPMDTQCYQWNVL